MARHLPLLGALALFACASQQTPASELATSPPPAPLPNATMATAQPLPRGIYVEGVLECGQIAWFVLPVRPNELLRVEVQGQAQEHALGANVIVTAVASTGQDLTAVEIPVFAQSPNWESRPLEAMVPPIPPPFYLRVQQTQSCQRAAFRVRVP
jgi:glucose/arabinose dehydrogenase